MLPTKYRVSWSFGSGKEAKNRFLRWQPWWPSWISDQNDLSYFYLLVTPMLPIKFQDNWSFVSEEEEARHSFSRWPPSWIFHRNNYSYFYLQVDAMLPTKFHVNWPFGSVEEAESRFSRWSPCRHGGYLIVTILAILSTSHPHDSYQVSSQ